MCQAVYIQSFKSTVRKERKIILWLISRSGFKGNLRPVAELQIGLLSNCQLIWLNLSVPPFSVNEGQKRIHDSLVLSVLNLSWFLRALGQLDGDSIAQSVQSLLLWFTCRLNSPSGVHILRGNTFLRYRKYNGYSRSIRREHIANVP